MIVKDRDNREVEIHVAGQYDDDIEITEAFYLDNDEEASDDTIDYIRDTYPSEIYDEWYQNNICAAEARADALMDR